MPHPFDQLNVDTLRRRACNKWQYYPPEVLPLWVADMDFSIAEPIREALISYARGDNFGYPQREGLPGLKESVQTRLAERYGWRVALQDIHPVNGIVPGLYLGALACASEGEEVIVQSPIYPPFIRAIEDLRRVPLFNVLVKGDAWEIDFEALESLVAPATRLLMVCNPHNPTGRVFTRSELEALADFVLRHRLWVVSDELHSDLVYEGHRHIPLASLDQEIAERTLTLYGPTKAFNIAGLKIGFVIAQNPRLLKRVKEVVGYMVAPPNVMAQTATIAAYRHGGAWLKSTLEYLDGNRKFVCAFLREHLPGVKYAMPEGTYLGWLDFRDLGLGDALYDFLLNEAKVGLNDGPHYGPGGEGFARLNFATSRSIVEEALTRIRDAWQARS